MIPMRSRAMQRERPAVELYGSLRFPCGAEAPGALPGAGGEELSCIGGRGGRRHQVAEPNVAGGCHQVMQRA
jgi:hypothetical protein